MKPPVHAVRDLGQAVKMLRLERKMTQQELADASGLDIRYIGSIERRQRKAQL
jgi:transcriptional regulator with XRE-family HTH domain